MKFREISFFVARFPLKILLPKLRMLNTSEWFGSRRWLYHPFFIAAL
jgi:hypothetical protein